MVSRVGLRARSKPSWPTPPKSMVLSRSGLGRRESPKLQDYSFNSKLASQTVEIGLTSPSQLHSASLKTPQIHLLFVNNINTHARKGVAAPVGFMGR